MEKPLAESDEGAVEQSKTSTYIPGHPYRKLTRELSAEDLSHTAVHKLLLNEIDKLESQVSILSGIEKLYHGADKENAILSEKIKKTTAFEILYAVCLAGGSALLGFSKLFNFETQGWLLALIGIVLILVGLLTKIFK